MPGRLDVRLLGPLEIARDGEPLRLGGMRQRALVAMLALRAGEVVSADSLIDAIWGEEPPATARTALQVQVSKLRKLLGEGGGAVIETRGSGYVLRIDADAIDVHRFDVLVEEGRDALARGEAGRARETLTRALELWRGSPLADLDLPGIGPGELEDLEEHRVSALEARLEADLALGRHAEAVPELERLLGANAMNERLHMLAATALYRAGRQADALETCARLRRTLSEELGIEPSPAVLQLEQRILNHDPSLHLPVAEEPPAPEGAREGRKTITALVCRIALTREDGGTLDPEAERRLTAGMLERIRAVIEGHGGTVHEPLGGRVVALFGVPRVHEDDAVRAVLAADRFRTLAAAESSGRPGVRVDVRAGVATGEVLVEDSADTEVLLSDAPLAAADRLSRAAGPSEVLLTQMAFRLAQPVAGGEPAEALAPGEDGSAIVAFRLLDASADDARREARRLRSPMIGRSEELGVLQQALGRVTRERACSLVTVLGAAGVGKSKLAAEFVASLGDEANVRSGRCLPYGSDITFWPVAEVVKAAAGIGDGDGPDEAIARIAAFVEGEDAAYVADQVAGVLGLAEVPLVPDEIFWSIRKFLEAAARRGPLVLVLDDLHWADATLLDLLEHVAAWTRDAAILLVCLARPELVEARPGWGGGRLDATNLTLGPLSREETAELLDNLLGRAELVHGARERIMDAAEGHPLFLEELLAMLIDDGLLQWREDRWVPAGDLSDVPIPLTVQAILGERIDRLSRSERSALERASVVGKEFSEEDLASIGVGEDLTATLDTLVRRDLIVPERTVRGAGRTFSFRHILLRDAVYHAMSKEARALDHEAFGNALERRAGERLTEVEEIVGYHFEAAHRYREELGMPDAGESPLAERAAQRLAAAGRRAVERDDMPAAASLLARADRLLRDDDPLRPEVAWLRTVALLEVGALNEASGVADRGIEVAERLGDGAGAWRLRVERSEVWAYLDPDAHPTSEREDTARSALEALEALGDDAGVARAYRLLGDALSLRGRTADASDAFAKALEHAVHAGDEREAAERPGLGTAMGGLPVDRGLELVRTHLKRARRPSPDAMSSLGTLLAMAGRFEEARRALGEGLGRARDLGSEWRAASISMYFGYSLLLEGDAAEAEAIIRPAVESLQAMGERNLLSTAVVVLAEALYRQGKLDEAMLATLMSEGATAADDVVSQMGWRGVRAKVLAARGDLREAESLAREATDLAEEVEMPVLAGDAFLDLAIVLAAAGKTDEALEAVGAARQRYEAKGSVASLERAGAVAAGLGTPGG